MFKFMLLFAVAAICLKYSSLIAASPFISYSPPPFADIVYQQPGLATVGAVVRTIPTSVSYASHAVVHKSDQVIQDVVAPISYTTYASGPISYASYAAPSPYA